MSSFPVRMSATQVLSRALLENEASAVRSQARRAVGLRHLKTLRSEAVLRQIAMRLIPQTGSTLGTQVPSDFLTETADHHHHRFHDRSFYISYHSVCACLFRNGCTQLLLHSARHDPTMKSHWATEFALGCRSRPIHQNHRIDELSAQDATECRRPLRDESTLLVTQFTAAQEPLAS